ncbi:hypothetical protein FN846DRAFT_996800 [Sphaerosporella brunnea]|uniref:Uncharacterized protein n=1 Tax=Sphaerosporella brunnea TaxID=1250544 RepID=A0A5J5EK64_9PEZI|nr:hypothetical protein FN846DRAFT_996800 [Sphaerosporella brunnea]
MTFIGNGLDRIDKYTRILRKNPDYIAAIVLDPKWKWDYVQSMAKREHPDDYEEWLDNAKASVQALWETQYKGGDAGENVSTSGMAPSNNDYLYALMFDSHQDAPLTSHAGSPQNARASGKAKRGPPTRKTKSQSEQTILAAGQDKKPLDEYERWCREPPDDSIFDLLSYWKAKK